jgi:tetratricopeptide (TPR) repeat protein
MTIAMTSRWFVRKDQASHEKGPFEGRAILEALEAGDLSNRAQVRREDEETWATLRDRRPLIEESLRVLRDEPTAPATPVDPLEQAKTLSIEGEELAAGGNFRDALMRFRNAIALCKSMTGQPRDEIEIRLAGLMNNAGLCLGKLKDYVLAATVLEDADRLCLPHWRAEPSGLSSLRANILASLSAYRMAAGWHERAMEAAALQIPLRRAAAEATPLAMDPELAKALRLFATTAHFAKLQLDAALDAATEAVTIYQYLATRSPKAFTADLNLANHALAAILAQLGRIDDARAVQVDFTEALFAEPL